MKTQSKILGLVAATALFGIQGTAHAATASAQASAAVLSPIAVTKTADLAFGTVIPSAAASTVTMTGAGTFTCGSGLTCSGTHNAAGFSISGTDGSAVTISSDPTVTLTSGSYSMSASLTPSVASLTLASGAGTFNVGGVLAVGASQAAGTYAGTFNVTVNYQ